MGAADALGGGGEQGVEGDADTDTSLMSRLTEMKLGYRDVTHNKAHQMIANIKEKVYRDPSFSPLDWQLVISSVGGEVESLTSALLELVDKACMSVMGEEAKVRERQDRHRGLAAAVRESYEQQIRDMRRAHAQAIAACEVRCRAVFGRAEVKKNTDFAEKLAALHAQLADAERLASVASEQRDALQEELDEAHTSKRLMLAKLNSQRQALETHGAETQAGLESELLKLRTAHEKLKMDVAKDVAMYKDKAKTAMERAERLVSKRNQGVVSEANTKMKKAKEQMQKLCNLAEHLRAMVEQVMGGVLKVEDMEEDDCRRLLQAVNTMVKELAPFNQESADMMGVTIKPSTGQLPKLVGGNKKSGKIAFSSPAPPPAASSAVVPPGKTLMDQYELVELQRKARELETEQAAAQALRHQLMQLKDELLEAVCRAEDSETALHRAQRQGQIRIMCALQQQWKAVHLERSWAVRKQRESLLDLKRMVADLMRDEHRLDEHARHLLRMQHRKLHTELTKLESGVYQCSTEYLEAHRKDLPGERAELTRFRRHSIATCAAASTANTMIGVEHNLDAHTHHVEPSAESTLARVSSFRRASFRRVSNLMMASVALSRRTSEVMSSGNKSESDTDAAESDDGKSAVQAAMSRRASMMVASRRESMLAKSRRESIVEDVEPSSAAPSSMLSLKAVVEQAMSQARSRRESFNPMDVLDGDTVSTFTQTVESYLADCSEIRQREPPPQEDYYVPGEGYPVATNHAPATLAVVGEESARRMGFKSVERTFMGGGFRVPDPEPGKHRRRYATIERRASVVYDDSGSSSRDVSPARRGGGADGTVATDSATRGRMRRRRSKSKREGSSEHSAASVSPPRVPRVSNFSHTVSLDDATHDEGGASILRRGVQALSSSPGLATGLLREGDAQRPATADEVARRRRVSLRGVQHRSVTAAADAYGAGAGVALGMNDNDGNSDSEVGYYSSGGYSATELSTPGSHDRSLYSIPGSPSTKQVGEASASPRWSRNAAEHTTSPNIETIVARGRSIDSDGELGRPTTPTTRHRLASTSPRPTSASSSVLSAIPSVSRTQSPRYTLNVRAVSGGSPPTERASPTDATSLACASSARRAHSTGSLSLSLQVSMSWEGESYHHMGQGSPSLGIGHQHANVSPVAFSSRAPTLPSIQRPSSSGGKSRASSAFAGRR